MPDQPNVLLFFPDHGTAFLACVAGVSEKCYSVVISPHILCTLTTNDVIPVEYVDAALTDYVETSGWDAQYVGRLRQRYLDN
ncbi:hypothetical protein BRC92_07085 [Halobacteriales archaeon QS_4_69_31]|nr:MAG: hypothetical protein BRC92_07085 [Halobacteriales archaeon QS_4_69_31]